MKYSIFLFSQFSCWIAELKLHWWRLFMFLMHMWNSDITYSDWTEPTQFNCSGAKNSFSTQSSVSNSNFVQPTFWNTSLNVCQGRLCKHQCILRKWLSFCNWWRYAPSNPQDSRHFKRIWWSSVSKEWDKSIKRIRSCFLSHAHHPRLLRLQTLSVCRRWGLS